MSQAGAEIDDGWPRQVYAKAQQAGISLVTTVPDAGLTGLLRLFGDDDDMRVVTLSTEEEGIGIAYGAWLGGVRALLCLQSSGTGNCINALALPAFARCPCLMLVTMRGQAGEGNSAQFPMGGAVRTVFEAMGVVCLEAMREEEVAPLFGQAAGLAFNEGKAAALLISQQVIGAKSFVE